MQSDVVSMLEQLSLHHSAEASRDDSTADVCHVSIVRDSCAWFKCMAPVIICTAVCTYQIVRSLWLLTGTTAASYGQLGD